MKIIQAKYIIQPNQVLLNYAIVFDKKILDIDKIDIILQKYPDIEVIDTGTNSVIMAGLINSHVHLEFSANISTLAYGNFISWLKSIMLNREELMQYATTKIISSKLDEAIKNGTTSFGAISSNGYDLEACISSKAKIVYFNEAIGSTPSMVDALYADFKSRLDSAMEYKSDQFIPAVAIHSPYAIHPIFIKKVLDLAKRSSLKVSAHLLESKAEREWLDKSSGEMAEFFEQLLSQKSSLISSNDFISLFDDNDTIFTHALELNSRDKELLKKSNHSIAHCATSNRLLTNSKFDLETYSDTNIAIGTDGLSSNISLNMFDELRNLLFIHESINIEELSKRLLSMATINSANALGLNSGKIECGRDADFLVIKLNSDFKDISYIYSNIILHTKRPEMVFISGDIYE